VQLSNKKVHRHNQCGHSSRRVRKHGPNGTLLRNIAAIRSAMQETNGLNLTDQILSLST